MQPTLSPIRQNRLANLLIEASPVSIVLTNPVGIIEVVNNVTESWFGYRELELVERFIETIIPLPTARDETSQNTCFPSHLQDSNGVKLQEIVGRRKDGSEFPVRVTLHPLVTVFGEMVLANIVNLCESDLQLEKRIAGERLAAVLEMVSGLSHESRNALQRAQSCLDLLELDLANQPELLHLTQRIRTALSDLHNNYEEVKDYASTFIFKRTRVSLPLLIRSAFDEVAEESSGYLPRLHIQCAPECERVTADAQRMQQVFRNLLENAMQATSSTGKIEAKCRCLSSSAVNSVEITIRDQGIGLNEEVKKRMFEPFYTTKQQGTGLGLAVCRRIIEAHDGTIDAANHPGGGVVVRIVLPN